MPVKSFATSLAAAGTRLLPRRAFVIVHADWRDRLATVGPHTADYPRTILAKSPAATLTATHASHGRRAKLSILARTPRAVAGPLGWRAGSPRVGVVPARHDAPDWRPRVCWSEWIAAGEDGRGRAFLVLKAVAGAVDLRRRIPSRPGNHCGSGGRSPRLG